MKKTRKTRCGTIRRNISSNINICDVRGSSVEIRINSSSEPFCIVISGAKSFKNYMPELVSVNLGKKDINIVGKSLECSTFSEGVVELTGVIDDINFG